jgi:hypothetical protein
LLRRPRAAPEAGVVHATPGVAGWPAPDEGRRGILVRVRFERAVRIEPRAADNAAAIRQRASARNAGVTEYAYTPFGKFIVFLDNGQVWRQAEGDADHAIFHKIAKDNRVTISRGALGSYNLKVNDSDKIFKVDRAK